MFWIYVLVGTAGIVALIPTILQMVDGHAIGMPQGVVGSGGTSFGAVGIVLGFTSLRTITAFIVALAVGAAVALLFPELIKGTETPPTMTAAAGESTRGPD